MVHAKGLTKSIYQARQLITHGHIAIDGRRVPSPSYLVLRDEEARIAYTPTSNLSKPDHPLRQALAAAKETKPQGKPTQYRRERTEEHA
jgi:ribosomal protein S4